MTGVPRRARPTEAEHLTAIAHAAKASWGYPSAWIERWRPELTVDEQFIDAHPVFVIDQDGAIAGFYALSGAGGRQTLEHLWVAPRCMGRGIGRSLLRHARTTAHRLGARELYLESDPHAAGFYRHMGGREIGHVDASIHGVTRSLPLFILTLSEDT